MRANTWQSVGSIGPPLTVLVSWKNYLLATGGICMAAKFLLQVLKDLNWRFVVRGTIVFLVGLFALTPVALGILLMPVVGQPIYDRLIFQPLKYPSGRYEKLAVKGIAPEEIFFKSKNGNKLHGLMYALPLAKKVVLLSHGNSGNISQRGHLVDLLLKDGVSVFVYDYAGYGRSEGKVAMETLVQDGRSAYNYLTRERHLRAEEIILFGESLGTLVTGKLAQSVQCAAVILECPLYSLRRVGCDKLPYLSLYPDWAWSNSCKQLDISMAMNKKRSPVLLIAGTSDNLTRIKQADELYAAIAAPKAYIRIEGAQHGDAVMMKSKEYKEGLRDFIASL